MPPTGDSQQDGAATARIRVITVTPPSGRGPLRLNAKELRDTVVKEFYCKKYSSYKSEMDWASAVEGVRHRAAELGGLISDSRCRSKAARFFVRGCQLT